MCVGGGGLQNARGRSKSDFTPTTGRGHKRLYPVSMLGGGEVKGLGETSKFPTVG